MGGWAKSWGGLLRVIGNSRKVLCIKKVIHTLVQYEKVCIFIDNKKFENRLWRYWYDKRQSCGYKLVMGNLKKRHNRINQTRKPSDF